MATDQYGYDWGWNTDGSFDYDRNPSTTDDTGNMAPQYDPIAYYSKQLGKLEPTPKEEEAQRVAEFDSARNRIYNDAMYRGMRGEDIDELIKIGEGLARAGLLANPASASARDVMQAYTTQQQADTSSPAGYMHDLINEYGYDKLQELNKTLEGRELLAEIVQGARDRNITLGNIPGLYDQVNAQGQPAPMGTASYGDIWDRLNPTSEKFNIGEGAKAIFSNPLSFLPTPVQAVVGLGNAFGKTLGTWNDPETNVGYAVGPDGKPYAFDTQFRNPQPNEPGGATPLIDQVSPVTTAFQGAPGFDRNTALDQLIESTIGGTVNPGIEDDYFNRIIKEGILGRNFDLGADATQQQFEGTFGSSRLGEELLGAESGRLRDVSRGQIGDVFTGKAFEPITDDSAINNILAEKRSSAFGDISKFGSRGNLSTTGGATAGQFISGREPQARTRLEEIGAGVRESGQRSIDVIRDRALQQAGTFNLGDEFFDIAPFTAERETAIQGRLPSIGPDIRSQLGAERLFDTQAAIREGAKSQGLVSGAPSFLDELASRSGQRSQRDRGIGSIGSGVF